MIKSYPEPERALMFDRWIHQLSKLKLWSSWDYKFICYMDSDVCFFGNNTLSEIVDECCKGFQQSKDLCGFEQECENNQVENNREQWGMRYMQASFFCLQPDPTLFAKLEDEIVHPFIQGNMTYAGKDVTTEQDLMNLYFKDRIHYLDCKYKTDNRLVHSKKNVARWAEWNFRSKAKARQRARWNSSS
jgi:hypothetical protein